MERNITELIKYISNCTLVCMENLPVLEAGQLATCVSLLNEWKEKRDLAQQNIERQKRDILDIMRTLHRQPQNRDYCIYTKRPELYGDLEGYLPDGILLTSTHGHVQRRFDVTRFREKYPEQYEEFVREVQYGCRILTGKEVMALCGAEKGKGKNEE